MQRVLIIALHHMIVVFKFNYKVKGEVADLYSGFCSKVASLSNFEKSAPDKSVFLGSQCDKNVTLRHIWMPSYLQVYLIVIL